MMGTSLPLLPMFTRILLTFILAISVVAIILSANV
jgi:hypothetical protein